MFTDQFTALHLKKLSVTLEARENEEQFPVFDVDLGLEPLTYDQAKQLGHGVAGHCFTEKKGIRPEMKDITIALDQPEQCLIARMAHDVEENCRLRHVRIRRLKISKRDASGDGSRKTKKVSPQQPTLSAVFQCRIDCAEQAHQAFLIGFFGRTMFYTFEPEQESLFTGVYTDADGDDEPQGELEMAPAQDPDAGDVLDEQRELDQRGKKKGGRKPRLVKGTTAPGPETVQ